MPKRLKYTQVLGLNSRGLSRHQKRQLVWKRDVKGRLEEHKYAKLAAPAPKGVVNEYYDKYHVEEQRFEAMGLKQFLHNPSAVLSISKQRRKSVDQKLRNAQLRIEALKHKYSVAIPDKQTLQILAVLAKGQGIVQMRTNNHCNGYWSHLLSKKNVACKVFNAFRGSNHDDAGGAGATAVDETMKVWHNKLIQKKKQKQSNKKQQKSKQLLAMEAAQWMKMANNDAMSTVKEMLKDYAQFVLLMIYPDFIFDHSVLTEQENAAAEVDASTTPKTVEDATMFDDADKSMSHNDGYQKLGTVLTASADKTCVLPSVECLRRFNGNYAVHIGELFGCTFDASNPWGSTTSMQFQIELQTHFHKVYQHEMCRWPLFRDTLTVWKRNKIINVGQHSIVHLQDTELNDSLNTKFWQAMCKQRMKGNKEAKKKSDSKREPNGVHKKM